MAYRAVIFDFFGTLVPIFSLEKNKYTLHEMASVIGAPRDRFVERWFETFNKRATGKFHDVESNIRAICKELDVNPSYEQYSKAVKLRIEFCRTNIVPKESVLDVLRDLKNLQYKIGLISDCSTELPLLWNESQFQPFFDVTVFSCEVGIRKPHPEIYRKSCSMLEVSPSECLYIGDGGSSELSGAKKVGMEALLLFDVGEQGNPDAHRIDGEEWKGSKIFHLKEVFNYLIYPEE